MSEREPFEASRNLAPPLVAGIFSGLLYGTAILSFAFLLPVQVSFGRRGRRAGYIACLVSFVTAMIFQSAELFAAGGFSSSLGDYGFLGFLLLASLPPSLFLLGLAIMNASLWSSHLGWARGFAGVLPASLVAIPGLIWLSGNKAFLAMVEARLKGFVDSFLSQAGKGVDADALRASLDVETLTRSSLLVLDSSFVGLFLALLAGSWWIGNRISGVGSPGRLLAGRLSDYRLPYPLVWAFLATWTGVLVVTWLKLGMPYQAVVWNLAIAASLAYALQGLGIVSHLMRRIKMSGMLRICLGITALALLLTPPFGTVLVAILPLLGVTEVWIPYRNPKGVGA